MIVGVCGFISSGKNEAARYLQKKYNFQPISFADSLKQAVAAIFDWPFELLKGDTEEGRIWREQVDPWWSQKLNIENLTPRWVLQQWGTEVGRRSFHNDIWVLSLEKRLANNKNMNYVISDCRFVNEMIAIRNQGGFLIRVNRGEKPIWYDTAVEELNFLNKFGYETGFESKMTSMFPNIHISEWGWITQPFEYEIDNNQTLDYFYKQLDQIILTKPNN